MPLDAEIPPCMILQGHRLNDTVGRVRRRGETSSECGDALVVVTGDGCPAPDDLTQCRCVVNVKIMNAVSVVADRVIHVLDKITTERDIHDLRASADGQQRQVIRECDARHGKIKCILFLVDAVLVRVRLLARPPSRDIPSARQQHTLSEPDPLSRDLDVDLEVWSVRMDDQWLSPSRKYRLNEGASSHFCLIAKGRRSWREPCRNDDQRAAGSQGLLRHIESRSS